METVNKPKVIKDYDKLSDELLEQIKLVYPKGFRKHLVQFTGLDGKKRKGLPFETEDKYYLIRMTMEEAIYVIAEDDDYDEKGHLKPKIYARLADKHDDENHLDEYNSNEDNDFGDDDNRDISIDELEDDIVDEGSTDDDYE
ncbi:MAG: hypothetical protein P1U56_23720 [Saprospiraceae bacterium]|nr:hypothetical protein [Saprospiraceae bacterium]